VSFNLDQFQKDITKKEGVRPECKTCTAANRKSKYSKTATRKRNLEKNFGEGVVDVYEIMFVNQEGVCAICKSPENGRYSNLSVDHCHATNKIRGLLCNNCNRGIGLLKDSPLFLREAAKYIEGTK
tara:strand:+ start:840 stop:1217 length:378 start_codon:yes stop_codon:yes gene_type:complete